MATSASSVVVITVGHEIFNCRAGRLVKFVEERIRGKFLCVGGSLVLDGVELDADDVIQTQGKYDFVGSMSNSAQSQLASSLDAPEKVAPAQERIAKYFKQN